MSSVIEKLRYIVSNVWQPIGVEFHYLSLPQFNVEADNIPDAVIFVECPDTGALVPTSAMVKDRPTLRVWFLKPMRSGDVERIVNDTEVQWCKMLAAQFIKRVNESRMFEPIPLNVPIPYVVEYCVTDRCETGIGIDIALQEIDGISICKEFPRGSNIDDSGKEVVVDIDDGITSGKEEDDEGFN